MTMRAGLFLKGWKVPAWIQTVRPEVVPMVFGCAVFAVRWRGLTHVFPLSKGANIIEVHNKNIDLPLHLEGAPTHFHR